MATKKETLNISEQIAMCGVLLLGREVLVPAYKLCHPRTKTTSENSLTVMTSRWYASPVAQKFREDMTAKITRKSINDGADLTTRNGIISELIASVKATAGKDAISGLQSLAKIQGLDKPEEAEQNDPRRFFLAWKSDCRRCELMKLFRQTLREHEK
jgi:hypothetical protein